MRKRSNLQTFFESCGTLHGEERRVSMAEQISHTNGHFEALSDKEGFALFNNAAEYYLGISGEEFIHSLEEGHFEDLEDDPEVSEVMTLLPFARA